MNQTTIAGHLGADPEVRFTSSGQKVTTLRVAARVRRSGKDETIWWRVTIWGEQFDKMMPYLKKGSPVIAVGEMNKPEIFTDREGRPQVSMSLTASDLLFSPFGRPDQPGSDVKSASSHQEPAFAGAPPETAYGQGRTSSTFSEDEIPF
jgi:single-strand DNA-binding protein